MGALPVEIPLFQFPKVGLNRHPIQCNSEEADTSNHLACVCL